MLLPKGWKLTISLLVSFTMPVSHSESLLLSWDLFDVTLVLHDANTKLDGILAVPFLGVEESVDNKLMTADSLATASMAKKARRICKSLFFYIHIFVCKRTQYSRSRGLECWINNWILVDQLNYWLFTFAQPCGQYSFMHLGLWLDKYNVSAKSVHFCPFCLYLRAKRADSPWKWAKYYKSSSSNLNMIDIKNTGAFIKQSNDKYFMGTYRVLRRCKLNEIKSQRRKLAQIRCRQQSNSWREEVGAASLKEE